MKRLKCLPPIFCHFRGKGLFSSTFHKNHWKWPKLAIFSHLIQKGDKKSPFLPFNVVFMKSWSKRTPLKWQNKGGKTFMEVIYNSKCSFIILQLPERPKLKMKIKKLFWRQNLEFFGSVKNFSWKPILRLCVFDGIWPFFQFFG